MKSDLEAAARRENETVSKLLERIVMAWLQETRARNRDEEDEQQRLHRAAIRTFGVIRGGDPGRSERVREAVRARLAKRRAHNRAD